MPPKNLFRRMPHIRVSPFSRVRAWWHGVDAENLERYGERGLVRTVWMEWRGTLCILGCAFVFAVGRQQSNHANFILENIELNRQHYYNKDFAPGYVANAPSAVYDGVKGYSQQDEVSGLAVNADNKLTSNETREQRVQRLRDVDVSPDMVRAARGLLNTDRYQRQE